LDALKRLVIRESQVQPVLLVCEDLHWIDAETQALLDSLVESLPTARLLLLINYRPEYQIAGAYDQAIAAAQRVMGLATASGEAVLQALANQSLGAAYDAQGDYRRALDCFGQTVASLDGARRHERFGQVFLPAVNSYALLATCHAELGTFAEGRALGEEGLQIAEAVDHLSSLM
jgi:tetratricopeptide (TPR) repeat protein